MKFYTHIHRYLCALVFLVTHCSLRSSIEGADNVDIEVGLVSLTIWNLLISGNATVQRALASDKRNSVRTLMRDKDIEWAGTYASGRQAKNW